MAGEGEPNVIDMANREKTTPTTITTTNTSDPRTNSTHPESTSSPDKDGDDFVPRPMFHQPTHQSVDIEDYFRGPRDINRHSKWPFFLRLHGSILPKMIVPLTIIAGWATLITCISELVHRIAINSVLLTVLGFVSGPSGTPMDIGADLVLFRLLVCPSHFAVLLHMSGSPRAGDTGLC